MKKANTATLAIMVLVIVTATAHAAPISFSFSDREFTGGASWGAMDIGVLSDGGSTLFVRYTAADDISEGSAAATGFGFTFDGKVSGVWNPVDTFFGTDRDDLDWMVGSSRIIPPPPVNGDEFTPPLTDGFVDFTVTEGNSNNFNPPGILPGEMDIFYLDFENKTFSSDDDLYGFVLATGVRIQSLSDQINGGSLFLAGDPNPVPIPASVLLLGSGLIGLVSVRRFRRKPASL